MNTNPEISNDPPKEEIKEESCPECGSIPFTEEQLNEKVRLHILYPGNVHNLQLTRRLALECIFCYMNYHLGDRSTPEKHAEKAAMLILKTNDGVCNLMGALGIYYKTEEELNEARAKEKLNDPNYQMLMIMKKREKRERDNEGWKGEDDEGD